MSIFCFSSARTVVRLPDLTASIRRRSSAADSAATADSSNAQDQATAPFTRMSAFPLPGERMWTQLASEHLAWTPSPEAASFPSSPRIVYAFFERAGDQLGWIRYRAAGTRGTGVAGNRCGYRWRRTFVPHRDDDAAIDTRR